MKQDYKLTVDISSAHLSDAALSAMIGSLESQLNVQLQKVVDSYDTQVLSVFRTKEINISLTTTRI